MTATFTPDEEAEIELMLWEYDRDGRIAIDNFFRREPELSLRMAGGHLRWARLSEQIFRVDKWSVCRG
jgi:hypothetical protein